MDNVSHKTKPSVRVLCLPERNITFQKRLFRAKKSMILRWTFMSRFSWWFSHILRLAQLDNWKNHDRLTELSFWKTELSFSKHENWDLGKGKKLMTEVSFCWLFLTKVSFLFFEKQNCPFQPNLGLEVSFSLLYTAQKSPTRKIQPLYLWNAVFMLHIWGCTTKNNTARDNPWKTQPLNF